MKTAILSAVVFVLASGIASAQVLKFDTHGFEPSDGYTPGLLNGQQGWSVETYGEGSAAIVDGTNDPVEGSQALKLMAPSSVEDPQIEGQVAQDGVTVVHLTTTESIKWAKVSFDIWREPGTVVIDGGTLDKSAVNRLYWWTAAYPSLFGAQWDMDNLTYPFGFGLDTASTVTITGRFVNLVLLFDFTNKTKSSWYDGAQVDNGIVLDENDQMKDLRDFEIYYEQSQPFKAGTYGYPTYIDNLYVEYELASVPEPGSLIALMVGVIGLVGLRRSRRQRYRNTSA